MSRLGVYLLGPPRIELDEKPIHIGRRKVLALLAYLAVEKGRHSRETLAAFLAPEFDPAGARADLRRTLSLLNRLLGEGWLAADRETVGIRQALPRQARDAGAKPDGSGRVLWLDVEAFRQRLAECDDHAHPLPETCADCLPLLEEAAGLYQGDFLAGFTLPGSLPFDDWQRFEAEALRREMGSALERLVRGLSSHGMYEDAIPHARRWLELNLTHEPAHRALMELYSRTGQASAALSQYEYCVETLAEELGVPPAAETRRLVERIRAGDVGVSEPAMRPDVMGPLETRAVPPHNLPSKPTPFIGREEELSNLDALVGDPEARLITIVGPGGIGKTRLALACGERQLCDTIDRPDVPVRDGVFFVPLEALGTADQIVPALAEALGLRLQGGDRRTPRQQIVDYLRQKRMLLILDNFEHLLDGSELLVDIIHTAPDVTVLVTSRERLNLHQEQLVPIHGLAVPEQGISMAEAVGYASVQLFLQSSRRVRPDHQLRAEESSHLINICRMLDGMPLALELAASWVDVLALADIVAELQGGLDLLAVEWQDVPRRHRSMRAAVDASWRLLNQDERDVFAQLVVFRGGFTRQAAHAVAVTETGAPAALRTLARLVNKSFLVFHKAQDRYQVHELLRQYGAEKLADKMQVSSVRDRHCAFFCAALEQWFPETAGPRQLAVLDEIEADIENIRAAWDWASARRNVARLEKGLRGIVQFYWRRARHYDAIAVCQAVIDALAQVDATSTAFPGALRVAALALTLQAQNYIPLGHKTLAITSLERGEKLLDSPALVDHDTRSERAILLHSWGRAVMPNLEQARRLHEQSLSLWRSLDDRMCEAWSLDYLGSICLAGGDLRGAKRLWEENLAFFRAVENATGITSVLRALGQVATHSGDYVEAQRLFAESLTLSRAKGSQTWELETLVMLAQVHREHGDYEAARERYETSLSLSRLMQGSFIESYILLFLGSLGMDCYNCDEAERWFSEALTLSQMHHYQIGAASSLALLGQLRLYQGQFKAGADYVRQSVTIYREIEEWSLLAFELANLGVMYWSSGEISEAEVAIEEALALAEELQVDRELPFLTQCQAQLHHYSGRYGKARARASEAIVLARKAGYRRLPNVLSRWPDYGSRMYRKSNVLARAHGVLGWTALAEERYAEAIDTLQESLAGFRALRNREYEAWSLTGLGRATYGLGDRAEAQRHLLAALEIVVEIRAFLPLLHLMPVIPVVLVDNEDPKLMARAVELYALARTQPLVAKSPLFEDVAGKHIAAATADLPPDVAAAAQERGRVMDWWETADRLLVELREMGWENESDP